MNQEVLLFAGEVSETLAQDICKHLHEIRINGSALPVRYVQCSKRGWFNDRTPEVQLQHLREAPWVVLVQSLMPVDSALVQLLAMCDAAMRASAQKIIVLMPYFPGRQDKKKKPRVDISAAWIPHVIERACAGRLDRIVSVDLHSAGIQGLFDGPFDHLYGLPVMLECIQKEVATPLGEITYVSPDAGGVERVLSLTDGIRKTKPVIIIKHRVAPGETAVIEVIGDPGDTCMIVDDIGDSLGTLVEGVRAVKKKNKNARVYGMLTHAVLGGPQNLEKALANLCAEDGLDHLFTTDTIPVPPAALATGKITVVSIAPLLAEALRRILEGDSLNEMFEQIRKPLGK